MTHWIERLNDRADRLLRRIECWLSGHWWRDSQAYGEPPHQEALARVCRRCEREESL